jgi:hypothetical protein
VAARGNRRRRLAGRLAGDGQQGLPATNRDGKKYRNEEEDLGKSPGSSEGREKRRRSGSAVRGGAPVVALRRRRCRGEEELRGAVRFEEGARGVLGASYIGPRGERRGRG